MWRIAILLAIMCIVSPIKAYGEVRYRVRVIPRLTAGTRYSVPRDINQNGLVTGYADTGGSDWYSFRWNPNDNAITNLGGLNSCPQDRPGSYAEAMNDQGDVVGHDAAGLDCHTEGWLWTPSAGMIPIGALPAEFPFSEAFDVNSHHEVVGRSRTLAGSQGYLWSPDNGIVELGSLNNSLNSEAYAINDSTWIVGHSGGEAILWRPGLGTMPLGGPDGIAGASVYGGATAINELGQVAGSLVQDSIPQPFYWDSQNGAIGVGRLHPENRGYPAKAIGLNNLGQIVGYENAPGDEIPIIWDERRGLRNLRMLTDPCYSPVPLSFLFRASAINDAGWITIERGNTRGAVLIPYIPGDLDGNGAGNGVVDLQDLAIQLSNFARAGDATYAHGDLDCDRDVDLEDLAILLGNFGETLP